MSLMASPLSLPIHSDLQIHTQFLHKAYSPSFSSSPFAKQTLNFYNFHRLPFKSLSSSSFTSTTDASNPNISTSASDIYTQLEDSFKTGKFLGNEEIIRLKQLQDFCIQHDLEGGSMRARVMRNDEIDTVVNLLSDSFSDSMVLPSNYGPILRFLVKQYLLERREMLPHSVTIVAFYKELGEEEEVFAGTVEVFLDKMAFNNSPPSPTPPFDRPYICNMSVNKNLRRRSIGWNLLKATEKLIAAVCGGGNVYLHCRIIDAAPFNLYTKAGYAIMKTDNFMVLLKLQRRKYLMCKNLNNVI